MFLVYGLGLWIKDSGLGVSGLQCRVPGCVLKV